MERIRNQVSGFSDPDPTDRTRNPLVARSTCARIQAKHHSKKGHVEELLVEVNMAALAASLSLQSISPKCSFSPLLASALESTATHSPRRRPHNFPSAVPQKPTRSWRFPAAGGIFSLSEAIPEETVPVSDDGVSTVISALLFAAFIGLSVLTVGVIYISVTDFLQKRERDKFEKEEAAKKKSGKRRKIGARSRKAYIHFCLHDYM
ncbi:hypothetical protein F511_28164 [Dorcoceras hygrometricum]|uniref:Uncharacterized protein n=1 Tax=Dorcoceras hygrometricum TaxID=472368 RepID=A0A2Z7C4Y9_9LAMI|nr:hypothetical protein F511_28164 [Dorcoceras hygrometricum]